MRTIHFKYMNHNGKIAERTVDVQSLDFITNPSMGYQSGWFLTGRCHEKDAVRSFALSRIIFTEGEETFGKVNVTRILSL